MALSFCSFASGSSGNCYLVRSETTNLIIDVGIAGKNVLNGLKVNEIEPEDINGILLTHEHIDHVKSIRMIAKKAINACVYASLGTINEIIDKVPEDRTVALTDTTGFVIGDIKVNPFHLSHDAAEPYGYAFEHNGKKLAIVTDTGIVSDEIFEHIKTSDLLVLEANHEVNILKMGSYPYSLKRRILGDEGHLSNELAGQCLCEMLNDRKVAASKNIPTVILAHLSKENNTPKQAYLTIRNILFEEDYYIDKDLILDIVPRDDVSKVMEVK